MSSSFNYYDPPDVPEGMTLAAYRRARSARRKPTGWRARLRRRRRRRRSR